MLSRIIFHIIILYVQKHKPDSDNFFVGAQGTLKPKPQKANRDRGNVTDHAAALPGE